MLAASPFDVCQDDFSGEEAALMDMVSAEGKAKRFEALEAEVPVMPRLGSLLSSFLRGT